MKVKARDNLEGDDRRDHEVDHEAERRPPPRVGDEVGAVLPKVLQAMAGETNPKEPGCAGDRCGSDDDESAGDASFDSDDLPAPIAPDCEMDRPRQRFPLAAESKKEDTGQWRSERRRWPKAASSSP